ncbi:MAG: cupin domain-containing protein [Alphaproteobacteria bacterium]
MARRDALKALDAPTVIRRRDATLYVERGRLHVRVPGAEMWEELDADDCFFVPAGCEHEIWNAGDGRARVILSVAGNLADELAGKSAKARRT